MFRANKAQFLVIAALLVVVILSVTIVEIYGRLHDSQFTEPITISNMIEEVNLSIKKILGFSVGYYGSILQITGNVSYAKEKTENYVLSGLENIIHSHVSWSPSFKIDKLEIVNRWFESVGWSNGSLSLTYSLPSIGLEGINYTTSNLLRVETIS